MTSQPVDIERRIKRWFARHRKEIDQTLELIERSPHLELLDRSPGGERLLVHFRCKTLRTVPRQVEPVMRDATPVEILCPPVGFFELTHLRVAHELLPPGERAFNCHVRPAEVGTICVGVKWTPATFSLPWLVATAWDVLRGANVLADERDTFNRDAVPYYQRLRNAGQLPHDSRDII